MMRLLPIWAALVLLCLGSTAAAMFNAPPPFFAPIIAQTPPPKVPLGIDGTPVGTVTGSANPSVTIATHFNNEMVLLATTLLDGAVSSITTTGGCAGTTFSPRAINNPGTVPEVETWYAFLPSPVTGCVITVAAGQTIQNTIIAVGIKGASVGSFWDPNISLPVLAGSTSGGGSPSAVTTHPSTTHGNDMLIEVYNSGVTAPLPPAGFTDLGSQGNLGFSYLIVSTPQSARTVNTGSGFVGFVITDAIQGN